MTALGRSASWRGSAPLDLGAVDLRVSFLPDARYERAYLRDTHLELANLVRARLDGAYLLSDPPEEHGGVHLEGADLRATRLAGVELHGIHLAGAIADERTIWPAGFDPASAGVVIQGETAPLDRAGA
jgi:hypothetical protein